ncbi:polyprenol reductase-like [Mya arenaria]|uniref:polyprenol reductase-like n=1 Tax=Mya arenaria TaxID=6604 RepID=UPI0022DF147E|nr:polyprenol reductase-like [Mya arenaria]XP_052797837.1 polyprenol reductase-like [Mya arenaria]XP_052797923.1 polyprenol reductase-like [Mya arenaria]XP_052798002.1 polyprenol reductase-like [Mya arenaria]
MFELPSHLGQMSGLGLLWTSLSGAYVIRGIYQAVAGSSTNRDFAGEKGILRFSKHPIRRHFIGLGMNGAICIAAYNSYCFGISDFGWLQGLLDKVSNPGVVTTDEMSCLVGCSLLFTHTLLRWYQSVYINVFSSSCTVGLLDWLAPNLYTLLAGLTLVSDAPPLEGKGFGWFNTSTLSWRHAVGVALFTAVSIHDSKLQYQLAKLRKNRNGHVVSEDHKMPKGGMFDIVSSPQFLHEIVLHASIGLTLGFTHQDWWLCTGYITISQIVRGLGRQEWYRKKYEDLPAGRKAVIPYLL